MMAGERELTTGLLSKETNFRLIVGGTVGVKEIERLIAKLELDQESPAEPDQNEDHEWTYAECRSTATPHPYGFLA